MEKACVADNEAREKGQPAIHKLKLLPQVTALLNRTAIQDSVLDPETNFLQSVKYFLEPLNDGSLPAYNIQRDIFTALAKLPINKDSLLSSGIGKVVLFYTKSKRPETGIKRIAERLMGEWSRPILKRTDDYKKRHVETREFDFAYVQSPPPRVLLATPCTDYIFQRCKDCPAARGGGNWLPDDSDTASGGQDTARAGPRAFAGSRAYQQQSGATCWSPGELYRCSKKHIRSFFSARFQTHRSCWARGIPEDDPERQEERLRPIFFLSVTLTHFFFPNMTCSDASAPHQGGGVCITRKYALGMVWFISIYMKAA